MSGNVTVTNRGIPFVGKFDGHTYEFPVNEAVTIPEAAAMFLFGYGMPTHVRGIIFQRNGWMTNSDPKHEFGPKAALARLGTFTFAEAPDDTPRPKPKAIVLDAPKVVAKDAKIVVTMASTINIPGRNAPLAPSSAA